MAYREIWEVGNLTLHDLGDWTTTCKLDGGIVKKSTEPGGTFALTCLIKDETPPPPPIDDRVWPPKPPINLNAIRIDLADGDLTALTAVAQSEVGHFSKYGDSMFLGALEAVVDTVINRVAHSKHPDTISAVIDYKWAFSAIHKAGGWRNWIAANPVNSIIETIVRNHLQERSSGMASELKGATHFLNPFYSSPTALAQWGNHVVKNYVKKYGDEGKKDVHFHGFPPGGTLPKAYVLSFEGREAQFSGDGFSPNGSPTRSDFADAVVRLCHDELAYFDNGKAKETEDPQYKRIGEYWKVLNLPYDGHRTDQAWSAAFISWIMDNAGAGAKFRYEAAHCHYFQHFTGNAATSLYQALPQSAKEAIPEPGDIVHCGREYAKSYDFATAADKYTGDTFYPSHADIVVDVDLKKKKAITIGGNLSDSVRENTVSLTPVGTLADRTEGGNTYPWIGLLKLRR